MPLVFDFFEPSLDIKKSCQKENIFRKLSY